MFRSPHEQTHLFQIVFSKGNVTPESYPMSSRFSLSPRARFRDAMSPVATRRLIASLRSQGDDGYDGRRRSDFFAELREVGEARGSRSDALRKDTSNLFRDRTLDAGRLLDLRAFNHVIAIDAGRGWVEAEGMTTYEDLVAATLREDTLPAVVPELKTITLGGAAAGVGIEASSFRYGLVHESLLELDVLTGGGQVLTCRPDNEHRDLFFGFPNSYGTLGYALKLKSKTVAAKPYVAARASTLQRHRRATSPRSSGECRERASISSTASHSVPANLFEHGAASSTSAPYVSDYTFEHIYYRSIRERESDYLTARDFIWRWDTDWFWCSKNLGAQVPWIRRLYGRKRLGSRTYQRIMRWNSRWGLTKALDRLRGGHAESVIQDVDIPVANAAAFLDYFQREIGIAPVWVCPIWVSNVPIAFRSIACDPASFTSTSASGMCSTADAVCAAPLQPDARGQGRRARRHQVALFGQLLRSRRVRASVRRRRIPSAEGEIRSRGAIPRAVRQEMRIEGLTGRAYYFAG